MSGDILRQIDESIEETRPTHCGCGCQRPLDPNGPSLYYATQDCQARAQRQFVRPPQTPDRAYRLDALIDGAVRDRAHRLLLEHIHNARSQADNERTTFARAYLDAFGIDIRSGEPRAGISRNPTPRRDGLHYRRSCPRCEMITVPIAAPYAEVGGRTVQLCGRCEWAFATAVWGGWEFSTVTDGYRFTARSSRGRISQEVDRQALDCAHDYVGFIDAIWQELTDRLVRVDGNQAPALRFDLQEYLGSLSDIRLT